MVKWEYCDLYRSDNSEFWCDGCKLISNGGAIYNLIDGLNYLGDYGWELVLSELDESNDKVYILKRTV